MDEGSPKMRMGIEMRIRMEMWMRIGERMRMLMGMRYPPTAGVLG